MKYRAIFFDFDGVIAETMPYHIPAWETVLHHECGFMPDSMVLRLNEGRPIFGIARALFEHADIAYTEALLDEIIKKKNHIFLMTQEISIYPQIEQIFALIKANQLKLGLVTGTARSNLSKLVGSEFLHQFDVIITGESTFEGKPAPDPYNAAAYDLKIAHNECLVIENAPLGITAAKAAHMTCYALQTTLPAENLAHADKVFTDHHELLTHLNTILTLHKKYFILN